MKKTLLYLFHRDLQRLKAEIQQYNRQESLWRTAHSITNSAGNLVLHIIGNLNTYIGAYLGNTGYIRDREREFSEKQVHLEILCDLIDESDKMIQKVISSIPEVDLNEKYPEHVFEDLDMTIGFFLVHLLGHLDYHLGQINYHRRLFDIQFESD